MSKLAKASEIKELNDMVEWIEGELIFEDREKTTEGLNINPDLPLIWSGFLLSGFSEDGTYEDDIMGTIYYLKYDGEILQIYKKNEGGKKIAFSISITRENFIKCVEEFEFNLVNKLIEINKLVTATEIVGNLIKKNK